MLKNIFLVLLLLLFSACSQLKVQIDYDTKFDFEDKSSYSIVHSSRMGDDTLADDRIKNALIMALELKKYKQVPKEDADLIFVFHTNVKDKTDIQTDYQMVGYGSYGFARGFGVGMIATTSTYNYTEGTLVVDALNPKTQKIVWRGIAKDELSSGSFTPKERTEYINKVVLTLMKNFPREAK